MNAYRTKDPTLRRARLALRPSLWFHNHPHGVGEANTAPETVCVNVADGPARVSVLVQKLTLIFDGSAGLSVILPSPAADVGTMGTGSTAKVVRAVGFPSASVLVNVIGEGDMLNPAVLVLIPDVEADEMLLTAAGREPVRVVVMETLPLALLLGDVEAVVLIEISTVAVDVEVLVVVLATLGTAIPLVKTVVLPSAYVCVSTDSVVVISSPAAAAVAATQPTALAVIVVEIETPADVGLVAVEGEAEESLYPHIPQHRQLLAFFAKPIVLRSS